MKRGKKNKCKGLEGGQAYSILKGLVVSQGGWNIEFVGGGSESDKG